MYVLVESETGGVYAVKDDKSHERIVQIFSLKDDAERYHMMLDNIDFPAPFSPKTTVDLYLSRSKYVNPFPVDRKFFHFTFSKTIMY